MLITLNNSSFYTPSQKSLKYFIDFFFLLDSKSPEDNNLTETYKIVCIKWFFASFFVWQMAK